MDAPREFHYRLPGRVTGQRPGSHRGSSVGAGQEFVAHMSLFDRPDPRRLDLRASMRTLNDDWLVRVNRQRVGVAVRMVVDVSASMRFGSARPKLHVVADFAESLGMSAFRVGDALGMMAFDDTERADLFVPARVSRGMGTIMGELLRDQADSNAAFVASARDSAPLAVAGLEDVASHLIGQHGLVFLVSDFHWPLNQLEAPLDLLVHSTVVPVVVWDHAETTPPTRNALASLSDAETGVRRSLWLRPKLRERWRQAVVERRAELKATFAARGMRPFHIEGTFDPDALSRYFFEAGE